MKHVFNTMNMLKRILRGFVIKTDFLPFARLYEIYYGAALNFIVYILKIQKEVLAIYLTAGMARGDCVHGLSDIDLIIIIKDGDKNKLKIEKIYKRLSFFIPVFLYEERGIFTTKEIAVAYKENIFYLKYKFFIECRNTGKLLYGTDILSNFPPLDIKDINESILSQLAFIWSILVKNFFQKKVEDATIRNYLCYKLSAESCKAFILANDHKKMLTKKEALESINSYLDTEEHKKHIEKMLGLPKNKFDLKEEGVLQDTSDFCFYLLDRTSASINKALHDKYYKECNAGSRVHFGFESPDFILSETVKEKIDKITCLAQKEYKKYIRSVLVSPLDLGHIDEGNICIFIVQAKNLSIEIIKKLNSLIGSDPHQQLHLYIITPDMAISLNRNDFLRAYTVFFLPNTASLTFLYLSTPASVMLGEPLNCDKIRGFLINYFLTDLLGSIQQDNKVVQGLINNPNIARLPNLKFQLFFWQALRLKLVEKSIASGDEIFVPLSSKQVCRYCNDSQFFDLPWLNKFHDEYRKDLNGAHSDSEVYFPKATEALKKMFSHNEPAVEYEYYGK